VPLVTFGATAAAIIAVVTLLHGAIVMIPTFTFHGLDRPARSDVVPHDLVGAGSPVAAGQCLRHGFGLVSDRAARHRGEAGQRDGLPGAFVLYILFINLASAHHLLVDPGVGASWKIWNTSYAMYLAVLASMIHGFTVPASVEMAMRAKGHTQGLFGWVGALPWRNPAFPVALSVAIFGFVGGITGCHTRHAADQHHRAQHAPHHRTLPRHRGGRHHPGLHGAGLLRDPADLPPRLHLARAARLQPWLFGGGILLVSFGMSFAGSLGVARRVYDIERAGIYGPAAHLFLGVMGVGAIIAVIGLLLFVILCVGTLLVRRTHPRTPDGRLGRRPRLVQGAPGRASIPTTGR
jgi:cytochrome c oxidase subunit 1